MFDLAGVPVSSEEGTLAGDFAGSASRVPQAVTPMKRNAKASETSPAKGTLMGISLERRH